MNTFNKQRLICLLKPATWCKHGYFVDIVGHPDAIFGSTDNNDELESWAVDYLFSVVEIKPEWLMRIALGEELINVHNQPVDVDEGNQIHLHEEYNSTVDMIDDGTTEYTHYHKIVKLIQQIFGYMVINDMRYGLLTSYTRTWFLHRQNEDPDILYISPSVDIDQSHTSTQPSFLECEVKIEKMRNYNRSRFLFGSVLGHGRSGVVLTAKLCGKTGALKLADLYKNKELLEEMLNEIRIYVGPLIDIQGMHIPKLLRFGVLHEAFVFILMTSAGISFAKLGNDVMKKEKLLAVEGLQAIHKRGVLHGDIRLENIMAEKNHLTGQSRVWWIDFALSKTGASAKDLDRELVELKRLLCLVDQKGAPDALLASQQNNLAVDVK
ncbi:6659_t:CDS:2 [Paraglomus brasilianum]|uniref:6659_t:CDS:1 n=1 Tax=Paraglomus brasilianum TaxID=144538 RepID=A0A9N9GTZ8_9GLOM|nr:6659_t:CDS:2 [Paraglomus brasilianum]